ncbi:putative late blight resistance protein homolog R1B-23 [Solanum stenotomum]|uniref:putative late blight resistance protein homolog R1B-23 n=1 Tax=Solanum stenotomum TaxID=172797 RepID=UPI0020D13EB9|nr:putative late blight resistance protein homolog R1B-23 [Solanum stenotomum]XP_049397980.1 putative late blight resistance protein homolog R1B-23 [Solanum stenotomum]XP_049397981.1 putative late blight resistance protein homolog R1B-23 [Solanum stenotomum]
MSWENLQQLFNIVTIPKLSIEKLQLFTLEREFHKIFISLQSFTDEPNMLDVTQKVQTLFEDAAFILSPLYLTDNFDDCASQVQNKILLIKKEIRAKYSFPKISLQLSAKFVSDIIHSVLENIGGLEKIHDPYSPLYVPETVKEHIEDVSKELKLLRNFVYFVSQRFIEHQGQHHIIFFTHVLAVSVHTSMLLWLYLLDLAPEQMNVMLSDFLRMRIKPIQPCIRKIYIDVLLSLKSTIQSGWYPNILNEDAFDSECGFLETIVHNLVEVPTNSNSSQRVALKDHLEILQKMLNLLRANIFRVPIKDLEFLLQDIEIVVIDVGLLVYSLYEDEEEKEDMAPGGVNITQVLDLSSNIERLSIDIYLTIRKVFQSNLPRIHGLGYVDCLLNNLKKFQILHSDSLASVMDELQSIQKEFESLQPFLQAVAEARHNDLDEIQRCATQLIGKAHEVEYIVDACIREEAPVCCLEHWILDIMEDITLIREEVAEIREKKMDLVALNTVPVHTSNLARSPMMNEEIIGFEDVIEKLRDQLIKGTKERDVISVVGMPGLGKTTLAYRLYYDKSVASHFEIRAQCCVSQVYSRKDLLIAILRDAISENFECREKQADELADLLRKTLFSKRYLILVDDVWETSVWDDLIGSFRDSNNGSRIILTTRDHEVAMYTRIRSDPLLLRMFNNDESWELLRKKVFGEESCSPPLTEIGREMARKCGQLPLSVVLVAGILAEMEKKVECWEQLANNLGPHIRKDSRAVIEQSYQILPYRLRPCFLYFGALLEDRVISVPKLTQLWISEGFVKSCEGKSLEDIAEGYLENLIGRNLVMGTKRSSRGEIKACRIHDLLHDFCKERAKDDMRLLWQKWDQNANPSSRLSGHKQLAHRMCIYGEENHAVDWSSCLSHVVSIILHNHRLSVGLFSHHFHSLKFLKVLDMEFTRISSFSFDLVYLRYFAAETYHFSNEAGCRELETLKLKSLSEMSLPITLWEMDKLRHVDISNCSFTSENARVLIENSKDLHDLQTLSTPCFSCALEALLILRKTPNLLELRCKVRGVDNFQCYVLNFPARIETLKIHLSYTRDTKTIPFCISAPTLTNLTLKNVYLYHQHLSEIGSLQNLQVLSLKGISFETCKWEVRDDEFPQLRVLKLHAGKAHFEEWSVADDAFPNLEHLVLRDCEFLKEIPSWFGEISSLKSIEVRNCNENVDKSASDIRETQVEDYQNSKFDVFITRENNKSDSDYED